MHIYFTKNEIKIFGHTHIWNCYISIIIHLSKSSDLIVHVLETISPHLLALALPIIIKVSYYYDSLFCVVSGIGHHWVRVPDQENAITSVSIKLVYFLLNASSAHLIKGIEVPGISKCESEMLDIIT